jgi:hypothetical protein
VVARRLLPVRASSSKQLTPSSSTRSGGPTSSHGYPAMRIKMAIRLSIPVPYLGHSGRDRQCTRGSCRLVGLCGRRFMGTRGRGSRGAIPTCPRGSSAHPYALRLGPGPRARSKPGGAMIRPSPNMLRWDSIRLPIWLGTPRGRDSSASRPFPLRRVLTTQSADREARLRPPGTSIKPGPLTAIAARAGWPTPDMMK